MAPRTARVKTRFMPERRRGAPERFISFAAHPDTLSVTRPPPTARASSLMELRAVVEAAPLPMLSVLPLALNLPLPPGLDPSPPGPRAPVPSTLAFGRRADGSYSGFFNENSQVFRCGSETLYWALVSEVPFVTAACVKKRTFQNGPSWTLVTLKDIVVADNGYSSRANPDCVVGYWFNGPMAVYYHLQRFPGHIPGGMLHNEVWSYADGWDALLPASALQYPAFATPFSPGIVLASPDHVAMSGVCHIADGDPIRISDFIMVGPNSGGYSQHLRSTGLVLDPPASSCLAWNINLSGDAGTYLAAAFSLPTCLPLPMTSSHP